MSDEALIRRAGEVAVFAEVEPNQKERIVRALQKGGHVVGFLGDGINDAPALHAADVGISVADAVDVAREAAQVVLLEKDLAVLERGVREGRRTFANTLKYVFMATGANFGIFQSHPGRSLLIATLLVVGLTASLPYSPLAPLLGFEPLPPLFLLALGLVVLLYMGAAEAAKDIFYRREGLRSSSASTANGSGRDDPPAIWSAGPSHSSASRFRDW